MLLLDTEGLYDPEKGNQTHDTWIFTLAVLLSSVLIYNSKGTVDANALDGLYLASQLTEHVTVKSGNKEETGEEFGRLFPVLVWALRDHHLKLEVDGKDLLPSEYLEHCLKLKRGKGAAVEKYNGLRSSIKEFFIERHLICFPTPCQMEKINDLDKLKEEDLDPIFVKVGNEFTELIFKQAKEKKLGGKSVNGSMFSELAKQYLVAIERGNVNIESSFNFVLNAENNKALRAATDSYQSFFEPLIYPLSLEELTELLKNAGDEANRVFLQSAILTTDEGRSYSTKINEQIIDLQNSITEKNEKTSEDNCKKIIQTLYEPIESLMNKGKFAKSGGSKEYTKLLELLERDFQENDHDFKKGPRGEVVLASFLNDKRKNELKNLIQSDEAYTKMEKEAEILEQEKTQIELEKKAQEEEIKQIKAEQKKMTDNFQNNLEKQKQEFAKQQDEDKAMMKKQLAATIKMLGEAKQAEFKAQEELLKDQVKDMKNRMDEKDKEVSLAQKKMEREMEKNKRIMAFKDNMASVGSSVKKATTAFASFPHNVKFLMETSNFTDQNLQHHEFKTNSGYMIEKPQNIRAGMKESLSGHKAMDTATGCAGTVAWTIGNSGKMLVVMYSVPYSHDFSTNWCGVGIFNKADTSKHFNMMFYDGEQGFKRKQFYYDTNSVSYSNSGYTMEAEMDQSHTPTIKIKLMKN